MRNRITHALIIRGAIVFAAVMMWFAAVVTAPDARSHEIWINQGNYKDGHGVPCCGAGDCGVLAPGAVHAVTDGYRVSGVVTYGSGATGNDKDGNTSREMINEFVPYSEAQPSPDGAYWRCKKSDGSRRCFFAPPPGS